MFGPWWWSSSKRIQLLLQRSEFESLWSQQFLNKIVIEKNEKRTKGLEKQYWMYDKKSLKKPLLDAYLRRRRRRRCRSGWDKGTFLCGEEGFFEGRSDLDLFDVSPHVRMRTSTLGVNDIKHFQIMNDRAQWPIL